MPAYPYFPATYQPYVQNPYMQQAVNSVMPQPQQNTNSIIWVSSDAEADAYPLAPNNAVTLWHRTAPVVYMKQADASGKPSMKIYELVEKKPATAQYSPSTADGFATKEEVHSLEDALKTLRSEVKDLKDGMKKEVVNSAE